MKRHPSLIPYSQDHHRILVLAQVLKKDVPDYKGKPIDLPGKIKMTKQYFENLIYPHEQKEEEFLFPVIRGSDPDVDQLIEELISEHHDMEKKIAGLDTEGVTIEDLHELGLSLENHVRKEERTLFQLVQDKIPELDLLRIRY